MTVYEMRALIRQNYKSMCSDSIGSVKAALKNLESEGFVIFDEVTENNVKKRIFSITKEGRKSFIEWLSVPADLTKGKNIELGKLLFLGFVPEKEQEELLEGIINELQSELDVLSSTLDIVSNSDEKKVAMQYFEDNPEYFKGIQEYTELETEEENIESIGNYQLLTLQYGIDLAKFHISWFTNVKNNLKKRGKPYDRNNQFD